MVMWRGNTPLILASRSSARQALLAGAGIEFEEVPTNIDERAVQQSAALAAPGEIAAFLAREKALSISMFEIGRYVVGADQTPPPAPRVDRLRVREVSGVQDAF